MSFTISIKSECIDIDAFYPYEGWNDPEVEIDERYKMIEKCIAVCPRNTPEIEELIEMMVEAEDEYLEGAESAVSGSYASIEVDEHPDGDFRLSSIKSRSIENPFADDEKYDVPDPEDLIPEIIKSKFCFIKVWEGSGEFSYEGEGEFNLSKLTWKKGQFLYDGQELMSGGGDRSSSYTRFYKDGEEVY